MIGIRDIEAIYQTFQEAGTQILKIYQQDFSVFTKDDQSPLTRADQVSNEIISNFLKKTYPKFNLISEENKNLSFNERKNIKYHWLLDPLDGTKEFIKKNDEFCICLALLEGQRPIAGLIFSPITSELLFSLPSNQVFIKKANSLKALSYQRNDKMQVLISRSHQGDQDQKYFNKLKNLYPQAQIINTGSALKFVKIAKNIAQVYIRNQPACDWDLAAGDHIIHALGLEMFSLKTGQPIQYNQSSLIISDGFYCGPKNSELYPDFPN